MAIDDSAGFRIMCLYQPGGASERSMLLSQLVNPEASKTLADAVSMLRKWQQHFSRVRELQGSLPDSSLLLRSIDAATSSQWGPWVQGERIPEQGVLGLQSF